MAKRTWSHCLMEQRWLIALFLLPLSSLYHCFWTLVSKWQMWRSSRPNSHRIKVQLVQKQVREWVKEKQGRKMCTARPQWMSISTQTLHYKANCYKVKVNLLDVLAVDLTRRLVTCEPLVTVSRLMDALIPLGFTLPIVPEIGDLTIGGLVMGGGLESTSHKVGMWHEICERFEMVLADASLVECSRSNNSELFYSVPWSYGSIGFLTSVDLRIEPFKPFIKLIYEPIGTSNEKDPDCFENLVHCLKKRCGEPDSLEAIAFNDRRAVVMRGYFVDDPKGAKVNHIGKWHKPWFYEHVRSFLAMSSPSSEIVPTVDFYFRHHRPFFWLMCSLIPWGNNPVFRWLLGWTMPIHHGLLKLLSKHVMPQDFTHNLVLQDYGLTLSHLEKGLKLLHETFQIYPLWLCPVFNDDFGPVRMRRNDREDVIVDVGVYGWCFKGDFDRTRDHKILENFMLNNEGAMGLYAETWMNEEDFEAIFDCKHNAKMRLTLPLTLQAFPSIYEKISKIGRS